MSLGFISERTFNVNGLNFAAKEWGTPGATPVIALHGWLDNAASFDVMLPHMDNFHVIAIDCAGHGNSSFRSADSSYNIWQDIPEVMGIGPVPAVENLMAKTGLSILDFDVIESNEAFAAQAVAVNKGLGLDPVRVNPNGGAIALGHPVGATGAIIMVKLMAELERSGGTNGLATMCIGGGQGIAVAIERL